jgi:hypothetical protein
MRRVLIFTIIVVILLATPIDTADPEASLGDRIRLEQEPATPSADPGVSIDMTPSIVLEMAGGDITPHGDTWS